MGAVVGTNLELLVSLGHGKGLPVLLGCHVLQSGQSACWALKTVSLLLRKCVKVKLPVSEKLLQLCSGLREEIIWFPSLGTI